MTDLARQKLILALDFPSLEPALELAQSLAPLVGMFKINIHLFTAAGPIGVEKLHRLGREIFLDLKFHDIPNTVAGAVSSAISLPGIWLLNVHALGGLEMMRAAVTAREGSALAKATPKSHLPKLIGVTILTSMDNRSLREVGIAGPSSKRVVKLARLTQKAGLDGVVASPHEVRAIRRACGKGFLIVVPGVRPEFAGTSKASGKSKKDDQSRVATPAEAIRAGADYLVVGRPITGAPDPESAAQAILDEISSALSRT